MRILLLMLLPIGDTLFTTPAIHALRKRYPDARITALAYPTNAGVIAANPDIDEILRWPTRQTWEEALLWPRLFWSLRAAGYDLAVEFSNYMIWISALSRIPRRAEMNLPHLWWAIPGAGRKWRKKHAVEHYADVVRRLGIPVEDTRLRITVTPKEEARARSWLERYEVEPGELLVGMHPGGEGLWGRKRWPIDRFLQVADGLYDRVRARVLVMGGREDAALASELASRTHAHVINAAGQTSLGETAALAGHCALFIGNDSSPLHIACAAGTPVVGIYGPTDPRSYRPWVPGGQEGADYAVVRSPSRCANRFPLVGGISLVEWFAILACPSLDAITPEMVLEAALRLLARKTV